MSGRRSQLLVRLSQETPGVVPTNFVATLPESVQSASLVSVVATLATDVALGNRQVELRWLDKDANLKGVAAAANLQAPSTTLEYLWGLTGAAYASGSASVFHVPFRMVAQGGDVLRLSERNLVSLGDSWLAAGQAPIAFFDVVVEEAAKVDRGLPQRRGGVR